MKDRLLRIALAVFVALAIPTAAVLARGLEGGVGRAAGQGHGNPPGAPRVAKPDKPAAHGPNANRPHNHGWYVSQAARNKSTTGGGHGEAVAKAAHGNQGKPSAASR